jgi:hypothetical protein
MRASPTGVAPRLAGLAPHGFEERIAWRHNAYREKQLDRRIQKVVLHDMDDAPFHQKPLTSR